MMWFMTTAHYEKPGFFTVHLFNRIVRRLTAMGLSLKGSRVLEHRGRKSGEIRSTPVNLLTRDGVHYLVATRGETEWVKNVRADQGRLTLRLGRRREPFVVTEVTGDDKLQLLEAYLEQWGWEVGAFFHGVGPDSGEQAWRQEAALHPVFSLRAA